MRVLLSGIVSERSELTIQKALAPSPFIVRVLLSGIVSERSELTIQKALAPSPLIDGGVAKIDTFYNDFIFAYHK